MTDTPFAPSPDIAAPVATRNWFDDTRLHIGAHADILAAGATARR
jgi:hypothetical protein